jgi:hypothetical protein
MGALDFISNIRLARVEWKYPTVINTLAYYTYISLTNLYFHPNIMSEDKDESSGLRFKY